MSSKVARCAAVLARCRVGRELVRESSVANVAPLTVAEAYDVQRQVHANLGGTAASEVVGSKVGCTTGVMQEYLNMPHPCAGGIYDTNLWRTRRVLPNAANQGRTVYQPHDIQRNRWAAPLGLECEIAVVLKAQLGPGPVSFEEAAAAVGSVHAAVELVEARYEDYEKQRPSQLCWLADDFFHAGSVLGPPMHVYEGDTHTGKGTTFDPRWLHLLRGTMLVDDRQVGTGSGADIIDGHPLKALVWLASSAEAAPNGLPAGWIVSLGSVCRTHWLQPTESQVRVEFTLPENVSTGYDWDGSPSPDTKSSEGGHVAINFVDG